jgi:hypothetical protein
MPTASWCCYPRGLPHPAWFGKILMPRPRKGTPPHGLIAKFKIEVAIAYTPGDSS